MNDVVVDKKSLLEILRKNREDHRKIFLEAQEGYRNAVIQELDVMLHDARHGKKIRRSITLVEPMDQTKDYDRAILMLEMSLDERISLAEHDFATYVLDQWDWKQRWTVANRLYSKSLSDREG